jgi:hypothetical protein
MPACRVLKSLCADRLAEARLFWPGRAEWALRCKIGWGAGHTVDEPGRRFAEWRQFDADGDTVAAQNLAFERVHFHPQNCARCGVRRFEAA